MIEGRVPPPFGLITPDALSPCLFTLLQQPGHEGVNKASSPSTAWIDTATRKLRSPSGPCQNVLCATTRFWAGTEKHMKSRTRTATERRIDQGKTALQQAKWADHSSSDSSISNYCESA